MAENWIISQEIDLQRGVQAPQVWANALIVCGDSKAHTWRVTIMDGGKPANLSGTVTGYFVRGDNATVKVSGTLTGNVASVTLDESCYNVEGDIVAVMRIRTSSGRITLAALILSVRRIITDTIVDPENVIPSLDDLLAQIERMESSTQAASSAAVFAAAAATNANAAAAAANTAAEEAGMSSSTADEAAERAEAAAEVVEGLTVSGHDVAYDQPATATVTDVDGHKHISFGLRQGIPGAVPTITFTAKTGDPGTEVQVEQSGTPDAPTVTLTIPRGDPGEGAVSSVDGLMPGIGGDVALGAVRYVSQTLEDLQKRQARENIGAGTGDGTVLSVDDVQPGVDGNVVLSAVQYASQSLTTEQQQQARTNIGAGTPINDSSATTTNPWSGSKIQSALAGKQAAITIATATLPASGWSGAGPYSKTITVAGVTASNVVVVSPNPSDFLLWCQCQIRATAQGSGTLAFLSEIKPDEDIDVNIVLIEV